MVGDLGGGSLELTDVKGGKVGRGVTLPLGGLSLMELSDRSPKKAAKIARDTLAKVKALDNLAGRTFYAVGGTWRSLARLHMSQRQYPMRVMHNYVIPTRDALEFAKLVERIETEALSSIESVSSARRPLLAYGAAVLEEIIRRANPEGNRHFRAWVCARGCCSKASLPPNRRRIRSSWRRGNSTCCVRARPGTPKNCSTGPANSSARRISRRPPEETRLRHAACLLSDIAWRAHPDYRGEQSYDLVANASFVGLDHPSRAYLALAASYRHVSNDQEVSPQARSLVSARQLDRARILGAAMRVAYIVSAAMPGVLPRTPMVGRRRAASR